MTPHSAYVWHPLHCRWHHNHSIHDIKCTVYEITYNLLVTSLPMYIWQDTYYVYDIILTIYDISNGVWMTTQPLYPTSHLWYLCNDTHFIDYITVYVCIISHSLHVEHHRHCVWCHICSWWHHKLVYMSWHPLCLWHHIHCIWCHRHSVYDI